MALSVTKKSNNFGRPYKAYGHHWIAANFQITGGSGNYEFRRQLYGNWTAWQDVISLGNKDGYEIHTYFWHMVIPIEIRDKNNNSLVWSDPNFELLYNNNLTAIPMGTTPAFTSGISVGATTVTVRGTTSSLIKVYKSNTNGDFDSLSEPVGTGVVGLGGTVTITIPSAQAGERYVATATHKDVLNNRKYSFESLSSNYIQVGGGDMPQLVAVVTEGNATANGKMITVDSVTGGNGNYSIGLLNNGTFDKQVGVAFEIPFGLSNIFIKDTTANVTQISVMVDGGVAPSGGGTTYGFDFRNDYSSSSASQNKTGFTVAYGRRVGSMFTQFDEFGNNDGRQAWAMASDADGMPQLGIDDPAQNTSVTGLSGDKILMHPHADGDVSMKFGILQAGTFSVNSNAMRAGRTDNPWSSPPQSGMSGTLKVFHNGVEKLSVLLNTQNEIKTANVAGFSVAVGDVVEYVITNTSGDGSFGHYHIGGGVSLVTAGGGTATPPTAPTIPLGTKVVGDAINGGNASDFVIVLKDGYPESLAIKNGTNWEWGAMKEGVYTFKNSTSTLLSEDSGVINVNPSGSTCPTPSITIVSGQGNSIAVGGGTTFSFTASNKTRQQWYKDNQPIAGATGSTLLINVATLADAGAYFCRAYNECGTGTASQADSNVINLTITGGGGNCNISHLSPIGVWAASPSTPFKAVQFSNTGSKPFLAQIITESPLVFQLRGKNAASSTNLQGSAFTYASGVDSSVVNCLGGEDTGLGGLYAPTDFPLPPNYQKDANGLYTPITSATQNLRIPAKLPNVSPCNSAVLQFGYSSAQNIDPTNWFDSQGVVRLAAVNNATVEVSSGGDLYQYKEFAVPAGVYHCFARQKDDPSNVLYIGSFTVS